MNIKLPELVDIGSRFGGFFLSYFLTSLVLNAIQ